MNYFSLNALLNWPLPMGNVGPQVSCISLQRIAFGWHFPTWKSWASLASQAISMYTPLSTAQATDYLSSADHRNEYWNIKHAPAFQGPTMSLEVSQIHHGNIRAVTPGQWNQFPHMACESRGLAGHISNHKGPVNLVSLRSINSPPGASLSTLFHPEKALFILALYFLSLSPFPIVTRHSPHSHGDSTGFGVEPVRSSLKV